MKKFVHILKHEDKPARIVSRYEAEAPITWQGLWQTNGTTLEVPEELDMDVVVPVEFFETLTEEFPAGVDEEGNPITQVVETQVLRFNLVVDEQLLAEKQAKEAEKAQQELIAIGRRDRQKCETALDLIAGFNRTRQLTIAQITQMQQIFAQAEAMLRANRPDFASQLIAAIQPDGELVTQQMKDSVLSILV